MSTKKNTEVKKKESPSTSFKAPLKPIITRRKSAQMQRQLRSKDKQKNVNPLQKRDYYPNKPKRLIRTKKITLPVQKLKSLPGRNKRKASEPMQLPSKLPKKSKTSKIASSDDGIPIKNKSNVKSNSSPLNNCLSSYVDPLDEDSLTEEDLLEILTCPSPVWWEEPPDDLYEESLPLEINNSHQSMEKIQENKNCVDTLAEIPKRNSDQKFLKKRSVLESVLSNIKKKNNEKTISIDLTNEETTDIGKSSIQTSRQSTKFPTKRPSNFDLNTQTTKFDCPTEDCRKSIGIDENCSELSSKSEKSDVSSNSEDFKLIFDEDSLHNEISTEETTKIHKNSDVDISLTDGSEVVEFVQNDSVKDTLKSNKSSEESTSEIMSVKSQKVDHVSEKILKSTSNSQFTKLNTSTQSVRKTTAENTNPTNSFFDVGFSSKKSKSDYFQITFKPNFFSKKDTKTRPIIV